MSNASSLLIFPVFFQIGFILPEEFRNIQAGPGDYPGSVGETVLKFTHIVE